MLSTSYEPRTCTTCNGARGETVRETDGETVRETWQSCNSCGGTGQR